MCMLCAVQRLSRRAAALLPWLVFPLIGLWALSQLFPPALRFELSSPRLGCVAVLLATLFWYEVAMPRLSAWRARRSALLRQRQLSSAAQLHRLRRSATRRCRNCRAPYRDQQPSAAAAAGRFTCSSCGHVSRRPVLDLPDGSVANSGFLAYWLSVCDWASGYDLCWRALFLVFRLFSFVFFSARWLWRSVLRRGGSSPNAENKGSLKKGENCGNGQESRGEKARRKAEEKRQAKLEKEILEEEERKQREEVARLVEETRRLRDEKQQSKSLGHVGERDSKRESERRKQERRKERDKGSNKSNSDGEEIEKRVSRESDTRHESDRRSENGKGNSQESEAGHGTKVVTNKSTRYFERVKGSWFSSSRGFSGANFFGRSSQASAAPATKPIKSASGSLDHGQTFDGRNAQSLIWGKHISNGNNKTSGTKLHKPMGSDVLPRQGPPKKSWHSLFTCSSAVFPCPDANDTSCTNQNGQVEAQTAQLTDKKLLPDNCLDNQFNVSRLSAFPFYPSSVDSNSVSDPASGSMLPPVNQPVRNPMVEEAEIFEDPCYIPDPVSLIGPVSESLDSFPSELGPGFLANSKVEEPRIHKNASTCAYVSKPSPIESPMSRLRTSQEKHISSVQLPHSLMSKDHASNLNELSNKHEQGTWQMWGAPLAQDALDFVHGPNWSQPPGLTKPNQGDMLSHPSPSTHMISDVVKKNHAFFGTFTPQNVHPCKLQNGALLGPLDSGMRDSNVCVHIPFFQPVAFDQGDLILNPMNNFSHNEVTYGRINKSAASDLLERSSNYWSNKRGQVLDGPQDAGSSAIGSLRAHAGSPFQTNPDLQSFWS